MKDCLSNLFISSVLAAESTDYCLLCAVLWMCEGEYCVVGTLINIQFQSLSRFPIYSFGTNFIETFVLVLREKTIMHC